MLNWLLGHPCCVCGDRHTRNKETMTTMAGDINWWYCEKHWEMKERHDKQAALENALKYEKYQKEQLRKQRYDWLEREIHYRELDEKAKQYGIEYNG